MKRAAMMTRTLSEELSLSVGEFGAKFSLRINPGDLDAASKAFGLEIPQTIHDDTSTGTRRAACLGPDEWVLYADSEEYDLVVSSFAQLSVPHALVDVTAREQRIVLSGAKASAAVSVACPLDLDVLAAGQSKRTVFETAQVVLTRVADEQWEIEVLRSFASHVMGVLVQHG